MALFFKCLNLGLQELQTKLNVIAPRTVFLRKHKEQILGIQRVGFKFLAHQNNTFQRRQVDKLRCKQEKLHMPCILHLRQNTNWYYSKNCLSCREHVPKIPRALVRTELIATRGFSHTLSEFSTKDSVFQDFMQSLLDEYSLLHSSLSSGSADDSQALRLQFLRPVVAVLERLRAKQNDLAELNKLIEDETDKEMSQLLSLETGDLDREISEIEDELLDVLVGESVADDNDIILEVSAGVGGQEAMLFSAEIFEMYCNYAFYKGWALSQVSEGEAEMGGSRKASVEISGGDVYRHLKHEAGVHRVQRVPKTEKSGRMHTSTITVSVVPKPREIDIQIDPKDLKVETMRGSGPGGQSVNTTDSAVRITHLPTGTVSECRQERSQIKNKDIAMKKLVFRMYQVRMEKQESKRREARKMQMGNRGRSEKIRTYNFQQDRVSDHRVKGNLNNIDEFMQGGQDLDELIASLEVEDKRLAVQSMLDHYEETLKKKQNKS